MTDKIRDLTKQINKLISEKNAAKRSMDWFKSHPREQRLYQKFKADFIDLDIRIVRLINEKKEAEEEFELQMQTYRQANESKAEKLIRYLNEGIESISGNDIKREAIQETISIVIYALERLDQED